MPARRADHHSSRRPSANHSRVSVVEAVQIPPPPPPARPVIVSGSGSGGGGGDGSGYGEAQIVQHYSLSSNSPRREHFSRSPRASVVSTRSRERDYYVDGAQVSARSPRNSYRYIDGRASAQAIEGTELDGERARTGERHLYNNYHGRKSGSVSYVNPRHSHRSVRSQGLGGGGRMSREKVVVVDRYADRSNYY